MSADDSVKTLSWSLAKTNWTISSYRWNTLSKCFRTLEADDSTLLPSAGKRRHFPCKYTSALFTGKPSQKHTDKFLITWLWAKHISHNERTNATVLNISIHSIANKAIGAMWWLSKPHIVSILRSSAVLRSCLNLRPAQSLMLSNQVFGSLLLFVSSVCSSLADGILPSDYVTNHYSFLCFTIVSSLCSICIS